MLVSLDEAGLFPGAVTTANNACGIDRTAAVVEGIDGEVSDIGGLLKGLESWTC